jgi:hypothetical protein
MSHDANTAADERRTGVDRIVQTGLRESPAHGRPLSERARQAQRSVESYLYGGGHPRWMERIGEIDTLTDRARRDLARAYARLREQCAGDDAGFAQRWRATALAWDFERVNELIHEHNEWFPIERRLPFNPRSGDYVLIHGRSYRRTPVDADWVLEHFPPTL